MRLHGASQDWIAGLAAFKAVLLEGLEVIFIVIAVGAGGHLVPAGIGALAACALVFAVGAAVHRPLAQVPENTLKFAVGVMLSAFGVFWTGEGIGVEWPGARPGAARLGGRLPGGGARCRGDGAPAGRGAAVTILRAVLAELRKMFLADARLSLALLAVVALAAGVHALAPAQAAAAVLLAGTLAVFLVAVGAAARRP